MFYMLDVKRFDYMPRGLPEPWDEIKTHPDLNLTIEHELMLIYPSPSYFFVSRDNLPLAEDLERGLNAAVASGAFDHVPSLRQGAWSAIGELLRKTLLQSFDKYPDL